MRRRVPAIAMPEAAGLRAGAIGACTNPVLFMAKTTSKTTAKTV
jgi:hypothetical protein